MNPPRDKLALLNWLAIYPLITLLLWVARPHLGTLALPLQTLLLTAVLVPTMTFVVMPRLTWIFRGWLLRGPQAAPSRAQEV
ncbi:hypothetical protein [Deinococcus aestuarii]|uniref:hypothetical protein n=1 Tax=Deinococcus aestuarii TaxID=2774531 RepID=UPI001C0E1189|nr:hypothetical protein [Deinococcus aestuarii]